MGKTLEIQLRDYGSIESCDLEDHKLQFDDLCILKTDHGLDYGKVVSRARDCVLLGFSEEASLRIVRKATSADVEQIAKNRRDIKNAIATCREKVLLHMLPMKVLAGEYSFDRHKVVFYYTSPGRVDFRALVRDLAAAFKSRVDLRQIGPRDEAKIIGGIAPCGKTQLCCTQFMRCFDTITTRMAKVQRLPVHQEKLVGLCGQLKCCLKFELDTYEEFSKNMPADGSLVLTPSGKGRIVDQDILRCFVTVRLEDHREIHCSIEELTVLKES